jgi:hypothetical protein
MGKEYFKNFLLKNHWSKRADIYIKIFSNMMIIRSCPVPLNTESAQIHVSQILLKSLPLKHIR